MRIDDVLDAAVLIYRKNLASFFIIGVFLIIPMIVFQLIVIYLLKIHYLLALFIGFLFFECITVKVTAYSSAFILPNNLIPYKNTYGFDLYCSFILFVTQFVKNIIRFVPVLLLILYLRLGLPEITDVSSESNAIRLSIFATMLALISTLFLFVRMSLTLQVLILENNNVIESVFRSWSLTNGSFIRIMIAIAFVLVIYGFGQIPAVLILLYYRDTYSLTLFSPYDIIYTTVCVFFSQSGLLLVMPIHSAVSTLLYYALRIRREGLDIDPDLLDGSR